MTDLNKYFAEPWKLGEEQFFGKGDSDGFDIKYWDKQSAEKYGHPDLWWHSLGRINNRELAEFIIRVLNREMQTK